MAVLVTVSAAAARQAAATTLFFAIIGFVLGLLVSLSVAAYSLYACTEIL